MSEAFVWPELTSRPSNPRQALEALREQAAAEGRSAGLEQGRAEGRRAVEAELPRLRSQLKAALDTLDSSVHRYRSQQTDTLARVVHALCRQVLGTELRTSQDALEHILSECMGRLDGQAGEAEVHLHPDDHAALQPHYSGELTLIADPDVPACGLSVRLPGQAADFDPVALVDELFEDVRDDLDG